METPPPNSVAPAKLEKQEPESTRAFFKSAFSWFDKVTKYKKFRKTRRYIKEGQKLFDLPADELSRLNVMGPWTFDLYETVLAAIPAQVLATILNFYFPYESTPEIPKASSSYQKAFFRDYYKLLPSVEDFFRPLFVPTFLLVASSITAWACLRKEDSTKQARKRCRNAYLYYDGTYGLLPQTIGALAVTMAIMSYQRSVDILVVYIVPYILGSIASICQLNVTFGTIAVLLFQLNGYATCLPTEMKSGDIPAPRRRYLLSGCLLATPLFWILDIVYFLIIFLVLMSLVKFRIWLRGPV